MLRAHELQATPTHQPGADLLEREPDLLLGADFLLAHRIYIARSQKKLYFTYRGGPIFQPRAPQPVTKP